MIGTVRFHADLHIHSKYSRATSRDLDLEHLAWWACRKGVSVVGTGDFTHPVWRAELKDKLVPAEPGLFRLRPDLERQVAATLPPACQSTTRFLLTVEISTIYKKGDRTRKIHHLLYAPDFATADRIAERLARIGNIASDGRPILGLDSRHLLEITLESDPGAYLIPAHIWTPWFAVLGSQSGFDTIVDCYGDLSSHIFAVETGLSSDPAMNWRLSQLDRYRLVSNSDAHSPGKLGREATTFETDLDYFAIRRALETGEGYVGTVEFFPEEGKYHHDGHRKCDVRMTPDETRAHDYRCPVCGHAPTVGVLHRVDTLADRAEADVTPPPTAGVVSSLVPLPEVLSEIVASGPASKTVGRHYDRLLATLGNELSILRDVPVEDIAHTSSSLLADAVSRLRAGAVTREAGYDGEYGVIRLFDEAELRRLTTGGLLFGEPARRTKAARASEPAPASPAPPPTPTTPGAGGATGILAALDDDQRRAACAIDGALAIVAGPGSGKTRTLTHRIAHLVADCGVPAASCLAITFTRRAAGEMRDRLTALLGDAAGPVAVHTFHSLGLALLRQHPGAAGLQPGFRVASEARRLAILADALSLTPDRAEATLRAIARIKRAPDPAAVRTRHADAETLRVYQAAMARANLVDFDDLITLAIRALSEDASIAAAWRARFRHVSVDEFQDVDVHQYRLLTLIAPPGSPLCVIGDPDQAIYGFRGADAACFDRFAADYAGATTITLARNYRSTGTIVTASSRMVGGTDDEVMARIVRGMHERITVQAVPTDRAEADLVVKTIERLIGGRDLHAIDTAASTDRSHASLGFADFAVLYRTSAQVDVLREAFARSGLPFAVHGHEPILAEPAVAAAMDAWQQARATAPAAEPIVDQLRRVAVPDDAARERAMQQLIVLADGCANDPERFVDAVSMAAEADFRDPRADRISLLTLHAAKGLEFAVVFIVGLEDGVLPLRWGPLDAEAEAEERRLFYVGMTRARDRLFLSHAAERSWRGRSRASTVSPFLHDIEQVWLQHERVEARRQAPGGRQLRLI